MIYDKRQDKTCSSCGYQMAYCECGKRRNTSGDVAKFNNYQDYYSNNWARKNFAMTSRIERHSEAERKFMEELIPIDGENAITYIQRTDINEAKLIEHSIWYHLYGTRKGAWPCHTSSRYCFICNCCQMLEINRQVILEMGNFLDLSKLIIKVTQDPDKILPKIHLENIS